ncbi:hypothetical protein ACFV8Z_22355 [Streptomyces sp. NPDC059837]|uniref:hypothetical protein n=1 Tax=Streptomyces sp. NPDC059837 TaxID=3346968 RepID=UPI00365C8CE5
MPQYLKDIIGVLRSTVDVPFTDGGTYTTIPHFTAEYHAANQVLVEHVAAPAQSTGGTPGQVALA